MILVDSSVWIDYLGDRSSKVEQKLEALIRPANQAVITGVIFQEVLQGIRNPRSRELTQNLLGGLPFLLPTFSTHLRAVEVFRIVGAKGKSPTTVDALIAALALENRIPLFTLDSDFNFFAEFAGLKLY